MSVVYTRLLCNSRWDGWTLTVDELFTEDIQSAITLAGQEVRRDGVHIWYRVVHLQRRFLDN